MKSRPLLLFILISVIIVFVLLNFSEFIRTTSLSFGFAKVEAPLGMIMLGLLLISTFLLFVYALYLKTNMLVNEKNISIKLKEAKELADNAEKSRFTELHRLIESKNNKIVDVNTELLEEVVVKLGAIEKNLISALNQLKKIH